MKLALLGLGENSKHRFSPSNSVKRFSQIMQTKTPSSLMGFGANIRKNLQ